MKESFHQIRIGAAAAVGGVCWAEYASNLDTNVEALHERLRNGTYRAHAVKRGWIDKDNGKKRPLGILIFDFLGFTY